MKNVLLGLFLCGFACIGTVSAQSEVREVDFKNFTFQPLCGNTEPQTMTVKDGLYYKETLTPGVPTKRIPNPPQIVERTYFRPYKYIFADLDQDDSEEAIILSICTMGGSESYSEGFIYGMNGEKAELLARIEGGDRALGGIRDVELEAWSTTPGTQNYEIIVERSNPGETGLACCPEKIEKSTYRFENKNLVQAGEKMVREIYPPMRLQFAENSNQTSFDLNMARVEKIKRYIVSGSKGQTLKVSTTDPNARVRLYRGNAKMTLEKNPTNKILYYSSTNNLEAKLLETGDFIFEISNLSNKDLNFSVSVAVN